MQQQQLLQPLNQQLQPQLWQQQSPQPLHEQQQQLELLQVDQPVQQPQQQQQNQQYQMHPQFQYKPVESRSIRQQPARVKCPYPDYGREFHPNSLSTHIKTKHAELGRKGISARRYLHGACVDSINGIYMVRTQLRGTDHPIHCQFKTSHPSSIVCSVETCRQHSDTATRSGQAYFLCDHVKSTHFIGYSITAAPLKEESLDHIIDALKWLKPERKMECLECKKQASLQNVPLIVQMPEMPNLSARFLHFSVFGNLKRDHYWSFCKRVIVSYDKESSTFHCKCCPARHSCMHKCIVKSSIAQSQPSLLGTSVNLSADDDEIGEDQTNTTALSDSEQGEVDDENPESVANVNRVYYPPTSEVATKMVRY